MKKSLVILASLAILTGCATQYPGPANYGTRAYAQTGDPSQWQVVSVTPVPLGTGANARDAGVVTSSVIETAPAGGGYTSQQPVYSAAPVYVQPQIYTSSPYYVADPFWYPPVTLGLGFALGRSWGGGWGHGYAPRGHGFAPPRGHGFAPPRGHNIGPRGPAGGGPRGPGGSGGGPRGPGRR